MLEGLEEFVSIPFGSGALPLTISLIMFLIIQIQNSLDKFLFMLLITLQWILLSMLHITS